MRDSELYVLVLDSVEEQDRKVREGVEPWVLGDWLALYSRAWRGLLGRISHEPTRNEVSAQVEACLRRWEQAYRKTYDSLWSGGRGGWIPGVLKYSRKMGGGVGGEHSPTPSPETNERIDAWIQENMNTCLLLSPNYSADFETLYRGWTGT